MNIRHLDILNNTTTCALITLDEKGKPHARTMDPFAPEGDFTIWMATNPHSRKVAEIKMNPQVALYYADKDDQGYVTLNGAAQLVNDQREKDRRWRDAWKDFYPRLGLSRRGLSRCDLLALISVLATVSLSSA